MAGFRIDIDAHGLRELHLNLREAQVLFPFDLAKTNMDVADMVVAEAELRAPKGIHEGGGHYIPIAASIRSTFSQSRIRIAVGGARTPYAKVTEFGGRIPRRGFKGLGRLRRGRGLVGGTFTRVRAQPYLFPALEAKKGAIKDAYQEMLQAIVDRF